MRGPLAHADGLGPGRRTSRMTDAASPSRRRWPVVLVVAAAVGGLAWYLSRPREGDSDPGLPEVLRWGGDRDGGEPFIIERKGGEPAGFEGELASYLAGK